jgi:hypothetical protein
VTDQPRIVCGNNPRAKLTPGDRAVVDEFRAYLASRRRDDQPAAGATADTQDGAS